MLHARQFEAVKSYLRSGGSAVFLLGEGGEERLGTNVNYLLEEYGMTVHKDSVVRDQAGWGNQQSCHLETNEQSHEPSTVDDTR